MIYEVDNFSDILNQVLLRPEHIVDIHVHKLWETLDMDSAKIIVFRQLVTLIELLYSASDYFRPIACYTDDLLAAVKLSYTGSEELVDGC